MLLSDIVCLHLVSFLRFYASYDALQVAFTCSLSSSPSSQAENLEDDEQDMYDIY
jgi:hypothetical protein